MSPADRPDADDLVVRAALGERLSEEERRRRFWCSARMIRDGEVTVMVGNGPPPTGMCSEIVMFGREPPPPGHASQP